MSEIVKPSEYILPKECEMCGSDEMAVRVLYDKGITRYICLNCGFGRIVPKQANLKARTNSTLNNWAVRVINHHPFCEICGSKENLEAHHIIPVSHSKRFMYIDTNGMTLCRDCHWLVHNVESEGEK